MSLTIDVEKVRNILPGFQKYFKIEGLQWQNDRAAKDELILKRFAQDTLGELDEGTLRELIQKLWAFVGWTNKDYLVEEMMKTGIDTIRDSLNYLFFSKEPIAQRFDYAKQIRMLGAAGISELLIHFDKHEYAIWNRRARKGLVSLGVLTDMLPKSKQISGSQYAEYCLIVKKVLTEIQQVTPEIEDLFDLDFLLYYLAVEEPEIIPVPVAKEDFDHDAAMEQLLELGDGLGFEIEKEFNVAFGCRIDVLWRSRIANLGTISYAFEVHRKGSRDSAILNLQRVLRNDPSIQKVILVSLHDELEVFRKEIDSLGEDFRNAVGYFDVNDLETALEQLDSLKNILRNAGLLSFDRVVRS